MKLKIQQNQVWDDGLRFVEGLVLALCSDYLNAGIFNAGIPTAPPPVLDYHKENLVSHKAPSNAAGCYDFVTILSQQKDFGVFSVFS
jgi:hypothetical protein